MKLGSVRRADQMQYNDAILILSLLADFVLRLSEMYFYHGEIIESPNLLFKKVHSKKPFSLPHPTLGYAVHRAHDLSTLLRGV